jgi:acylphosphatase
MVTGSHVAVASSNYRSLSLDDGDLTHTHQTAGLHRSSRSLTLSGILLRFPSLRLHSLPASLFLPLVVRYIFKKPMSQRYNTQGRNCSAEETMNSTLISTHHIFVSGRVQGVFYRKFTAIKAAELGVTGWVRNLPDSRVEILAEGPPAQLSALESWCHTGSPKAVVTAVEVEDLTPTITVTNDDGVEVKVPHCTTRKAERFEVRRD